MSASTVLKNLRNKKINKKDLIIFILGFIIVALVFFGYNYFRTKQNPVNLDLSPDFKSHNYLFSIYRPGELNRPLGVAVSQWGDIFVADSTNHRIAVYDINGQPMGFIGKSGSGPGEFNYPTGVAVHGRKLYVADFYNQRIQVLDFNGKQLSVLPRATDLRKIGAAIMPVTVAVDEAGNLYISDVSRQKILVFDDKGNYVSSFGRPGSNPGELAYVNGIAVDYNDGLIYLSNSNNSRIDIFDLEGNFKGVAAGSGILANPKGIAFEESTGFLYVADTLAHQIHVIDKDGKEVERIGQRGLDAGQFNFPTAVAVDRKGKVFVADRENDRVQVFGR